ncbi:penicillin-binding transpeptidase domain-containing protein [Bacillus testis]|uniref:penicillin-binding transpeptidase domain-containing protein n=1 Tax=Bacillus testis TaxID=1622072 RepID=UPI00067ED09F|nr:penicillin-binding transpeptidase domain-containing protein [Bacillus testis]
MLRKKRALATAVLFLGMFLVLLARLIDIQLVRTESFSKYHLNLLEESVKQRVQSITLDDGRGKFYDRTGAPINHKAVPALILFPFLNEMAWPIEKVSAIAGVDEFSLSKQLKGAKKPFVLTEGGKPLPLSEKQMETINALKIPGVFAAFRLMPMDKLIAPQLLGGLTLSKEIKEKRYGKRHLASEVKVGDKGLQEQLDEFLLSDGESKLVYHVDGMGGPLFGVDIKYLAPGNPLYPVKVKTTLDQRLQEAAEEAVEENHIQKGGLILIDIESSEIRASVSRPAFTKGQDPNKGDGAKNKMVQQAALGSVFKTVVAAAAIEENLVDDAMTFNCNETIQGTQEKERPLGLLHFGDSFAQSCNKTFGDLAISLSKKDPGLLEKYAEKLQLVGQSGWNGNVYHSRVVQLYGEEFGRVWLEGASKQEEKLVAQTAIGQQDVQVSPLGAANMMATIARGGERRMVKAVSRIDFANGTTAASFKEDQQKGASISHSTALKLQQLLASVVSTPKGTAALLQSLPFQVAGKTGTAQTNKEKQQLNMWFAGYFPADHPKYAIAAVRLEAQQDDRSATRLVADFLTKVSKLEDLP